MTRDHGEKLIAAVNTIELQRKEHHNDYLTVTQSKAQLALFNLLKEEGFEVHKHLIDNHTAEYEITAQTAYNWNW